RLAEVLVQACPELFGRGVRIPDDRVRPLERDALAAVEVVEADRIGVRDVREAELLQLRIDEAALKHLPLDEGPRLRGTLVERERIVGRHARHSLAALRPPRLSEGSSSWPT